MVTLVTLVINSLVYFILVISLWYNTEKESYNKLKLFKILFEFKSMKIFWIIGLIVLTSSLITCVPT